MAFARVVTFGGVTRERVDQLAREIEAGERPRDIPATEILMLHDPDATVRDEARATLDWLGWSSGDPIPPGYYDD